MSSAASVSAPTSASLPASLPLVSHEDLSAPIAWRDGRSISVREYLGDVHALAALLPARRYVLNLCNDRYRFMVAFGAALLRGQTSVLPPNHAERVLEQVRAACPDHVCVGDGAEPDDADSLRFPERLARHDIDVVPQIAGAHVAALVFTSGSTGEPKPNIKVWERLVLGARNEAAALGLEPALRYHFLGTVPPQHMYGFESTVLLPMHCGGAVHAARPLFAQDVRACLAELPGDRVLVTTPIHIRACLEDETDLPELRCMVSAAAPLAKTLAERAEARYRAPLMEIYGFTEAGMIAARRTTATEVWRTMGDLRLAREGEGWVVHGSHVNGRVPLGDLISVLDECEFRLDGRAQDIINIAGKRASLGDLNHKLNEIPGVKDGVFHVPAASEGHRVERLVAFVVAPTLSEAEIMRALRRSVDAAFLPRPLVKVDALPRTASGKLPLARLRELEAFIA